MKTIAIKILALLSLTSYCYANPIGKVPPEHKRYVFPKSAEQPQLVTPGKTNKSESLIAYADETVPTDNDEIQTPSNEYDWEYTPPLRRKQPRRYKPFKIDIAPQYSYVIVRSHGVKKNKGHLWGISGEMEYKKSNHVYGEANFLWNRGDLGFHHQKHSWNEAVAQFLLGYTTPIFHRTLLTIFAGFGFRRVLDHKGYAGFQPRVVLNYYQYFVPCGLLIDFGNWDHFSFSLNLKAMPSVDSRVQADHQRGIFWKLSKKMNYEIDLPLTWKVVKGIKADFDIALVPFFKYWNLGGSPELGLHCRTQTYWGGELLLGLCF